MATSEAYQGFTLALETLSSAIHYVSFYVSASQSAFEASLDGNTFHPLSILNGLGGTWTRLGVQIPAAQASGSTTLYIRNTATSGYLIDGVQVEESEYPTTYIDGDQGPLYRWTGLRHGSASTRDAQERGGGYEQDLEDLGFTVIEGTRRHGMPPLAHNIQGQALQPGASYQGTKVLPREIELKVEYEGEGTTEAEAWASVHSKRQDLIDLLKPDAVRGAQPIVIGYSGANPNRKVYASFRYSSGLEFGEFLGYSETPTIRLLATDPFWYEDDRGTATLDFSDSLSNANHGIRRVNGQWQALGTGFSNTVWAIAEDRQRGRVYFGGDCTTANGVTINNIGYWDGTTFVPLGSGVTGGAVYSMAVAPNGDLWIGGAFTAVSGATTKGLARWNISTGTWTAFNETTTTFAGIYAIAISITGVVYIAGDFTEWEADATINYIGSTANNGTDWDPLGTSPFSSALHPTRYQGLVFDAAGNLWAGASRVTGIGVSSVHKWDGSAWTTVLSSNSAASTAIRTLLFDTDGTLYVGGLFSSMGGVTAEGIASYNGTAVKALGTGAGDFSGSGTGVIALAHFEGSLLAVGTFDSAGGLTLPASTALWNGSTWSQLDVVFPSAGAVNAVLVANDVLYLGFAATGTGTAAGLTTVTTTATTSVFPDITILGPTTGTATLHWLENLTTDERLYFSLTINAGETILISFAPGDKSVRSLWGARPGTTTRYSKRVLRGEWSYFNINWSHITATLISNQPLINSDFAAWHLLPGDNSLVAFITGTTTGVAMLMHWTPRHWSADGPA